MVLFISSLIFESNRNSTMIRRYYIYDAESLKIVETCLKDLCMVKLDNYFIGA